MTAIASAAAPFSGSYSPEGSLAGFDGINAQGPWTLEVGDDKSKGQSKGGGTLNSWSIDVTSATPTLSIDDVQLVEGNSGQPSMTFTVTRTGNLSGASSVDFTTVDGTAKTADNDYVATSGTVNFGIDEGSKTIAVLFNGDSAIESDESFFVNLSNPESAAIVDGQGMGTIVDDDAVPTISFSDFSTTTGLTLVGETFTTPQQILQVGASPGVRFGSAWSEEPQFVTTSFETTFTFDAGITQWGGFGFVIQNAASTVSGGNNGFKDIPNSVAVAFFTAGSNDNRVSIQSRGASRNSVDIADSLGWVSAPFDINDGNTHTARIEYLSGTMKVYLDDMSSPALTTSVDLHDLLDLNLGRAWVGFTGGGVLVHDWEFVPTVDISTAVGVTDIEVIEGNQTTGTTDYQLTVTRIGDGALTVDWSTAVGTATAATDFVAGSGQVQFLAGDPDEKTITVTVVGDDTEESHEEFYVHLSLAAGSAAVVDARATVTIQNDEAELSVGDDVVLEADTDQRFSDEFTPFDEYGINGSVGVRFGPDGNLYATGQAGPFGGVVMKYDRADGRVLDTFTEPTILDAAKWLEFHQGKMYVTNHRNDSVVVIDEQTGSVSEFVTPGAGGLSAANDLQFGPDGNLYVVSRNTHQILRYQGPNGANPGAFIDVFIPAGSGGLSVARGMTFNSAMTQLIVTNLNNEILRYNAADGSFIDHPSTLPSNGFEIVEGPDVTGDDVPDYFSGTLTTGIQGIDGASGELLGAIVPHGAGGLLNPHALTFDDNGAILVADRESDSIFRYVPGHRAVATVSLSSPLAFDVTVEYSTADGTATSGSDYEPSTGTVTIPAGRTSMPIFATVLDDSDTEDSETFNINITSQTDGASVVDGHATVTINDDDSANDPNALYVDDISFEARNGGRYRAVIVVRRDSNANGEADNGDAVVSGVNMTVTFGGTTFTGTTDSNGVFRTSWVRNLGSGSHYANVADMVLTGYVYDPLDLDEEDDSDGDGKADDVLIL